MRERAAALGGWMSRPRKRAGRERRRLGGGGGRKEARWGRGAAEEGSEAGVGGSGRRQEGEGGRIAPRGRGGGGGGRRRGRTSARSRCSSSFASSRWRASTLSFPFLAALRMISPSLLVIATRDACMFRCCCTCSSRTRDEHALLLLLAVAQVLLRVHLPDGVLLLLIPQLVLHELPLLELLFSSIWHRAPASRRRAATLSAAP